MLLINSQMEFDLSEDIKIEYVSQIEESKKALEGYLGTLEAAFVAHKKLIEENIKLRAKNNSLNERVNLLERFTHKDLLGTNGFAEKPMEEDNCFRDEISTPFKNQSEDVKFGSPIISKVRKSLNNSNSKKNGSQDPSDDDIQVLEAPPISDIKQNEVIPDYSLDLFETEKPKSNSCILGAPKNPVTKCKKLKQSVLQFKPKSTKMDLSQIKFNDKPENKSNKENLKQTYNETEDEMINLSIDPSSSKNKSRLRLKFSDSRSSKRDSKLPGRPQSPSLIGSFEEFSPPPPKKPEKPEKAPEEDFDATYFPNYKAPEGFDDDDDDDFQDFRDRKRASGAQPPAKRCALDPYDRLPGQTPKDVSFVYQEKPVRKKAEKQKLNGYDCKDCRPWYELMDLNTQEKQKLLKKCSKHRGKFEPKRAQTPESFWNPLISGSSDEDD